MKIKAILENKKILFCVLCIIFVFGLKFNLPLFLSGRGEKDICPTSEKLMISDLHYHNLYKEKRAFVKHSPDLSDNVYSDFYLNRVIEKGKFRRYATSLCAQRNIYYSIANIIGSPQLALRILHGLNVVIMAAFLALIMVWMAGYSSHTAVTAASLCLCMFSPTLMMAGKNLYWAAYSLFLPMAGSVSILMFKKGKYLTLLNCFLVSFITCLLKQLFYFEFVSTVMIAMVVPYTFVFVYQQSGLSRVSKYFGIMILSGFLSFLTVSAVKFVLLIGEEGVQSAWNTMIRPFIYRLLGDYYSSNESVLLSANAKYGYVLNDMMSKYFISIKGVLDIQEKGAVLTALLMIAAGIAKRKEKKILGIEKRLYAAWAAMLGTGLMAPLSWFILAKPHVFIHSRQSSVLWSVPFTIILTVFIFYILEKNFTGANDSEGKGI